MLRHLYVGRRSPSSSNGRSPCLYRPDDSGVHRPVGAAYTPSRNFATLSTHSASIAVRALHYSIRRHQMLRHLDAV